MLLAFFLTIWTSLAVSALARGYRLADRWLEFKRWARKPGYRYFGNELPAAFPVDLLADEVLFVHVHNCVSWEYGGVRHLACDLELAQGFRKRPWMTVVAVEGRILSSSPWRFAEEATALQGGGWVVLTPRKHSMQRKLWLWRLLDSMPPCHQFLEPDVIFDLWLKIDAVAQSVHPASP